MKFTTPAVAIAAFLAGSIAIPSVVAAQSDDAPTDETVPTEIVGAPIEELDNLDDLDLDGVDIEELENYEPSAEEVAEWNAENDKLIAALQAAGINVTVETDELGIRYPEFGEDLSDEDWEKIDSVFTDVFGDFVEGGFDSEDFESYEPTAEELVEWNAETEELIKELEAAGIPVERQDFDGIIGFDITTELTPEQEAALEEFFGACPEDGVEGEDNEGHTDDVEPSSVEV